MGKAAAAARTALACATAGQDSVPGARSRPQRRAFRPTRPAQGHPLAGALTGFATEAAAMVTEAMIDVVLLLLLGKEGRCRSRPWGRGEALLCCASSHAMATQGTGAPFARHSDGIDVMVAGCAAVQARLGGRAQAGGAPPPPPAHCALDTHELASNAVAAISLHCCCTHEEERSAQGPTLLPA